MSDSFATLWTVVRQASLPIVFPRQEYWGGLPFPSPGDLPDPGIEPTSPALAGRFFTTEPVRKPLKHVCLKFIWFERFNMMKQYQAQIIFTINI